ncbi:MAG: TonB-dependent receptor [Parahaliea sp.]
MKKQRFRRNRSCLLVGAVSCAVAATAFANSARGNSLALEEVIVTAQKRAEGLQDVPVSISAVTGETLEAMGALRMEDVAVYVPNLNISEAGLGDRIYIRGLGSGENQGFEQSVGIYVDGIYYGRGSSIRDGFLDMERVEVLRGPQGVLFGKNTIAGAINIITADPGDEFEGEIGVAYTSKLDEKEVTGILSGPVSDTFGARLAYRYTESDGYVKNTGFGGRDEPNEENQIARLTLTWQPDDMPMSARFKWTHSEFDVIGRQMDMLAEPLITGALVPPEPIIGETKLNYSSGRNASDTDFSNNDSFSLNVDFYIGSHTLTLVSGYTQLEYDRTMDGDRSLASTVEFFNFDEEFDQFSQEVRWTSPGGETVDYIVGAYYQTSDLSTFEAGALPSLGLDWSRDFGVDSDTWAIFGQATWNVTDRFRVMAGLRYTEEDKSGERDFRFFAPGTKTELADVPLISPPILAGTPIANIPGALYQDILSRNPSIPTGLAGFGEPHQVDGKRDEEALTPMLTIQYDLGDSMIYATASTGFKAGGFDTRSNLPIQFQFDEEKVLAGEVGAKLRLLGGAAELNIAAFYMQFEDLQTSTFDGNIGFLVDNAGEATSQGVELDGRWLLTENLTLNGAIGWLDFQFDEFPGAQCFVSNYRVPDNRQPDGTCDFAGKENAYTPEWTGNLGLRHVYAFDNMELLSSVDVVFMDNHYTLPDLNPGLEHPAYYKINARVALASLDNRWEVALLGRNLTDELTFSNSANVPLISGAYNVFLDPPRTLTLQGTYRF